jgi:ABC-type branched-subunit amino acid transport system ATPase component
MSAPASEQPPAAERAPALVVDGVVAGYGGGDVLRGVTFEVPAGEITCVVGPNGAGKSTLLRVISGLLRPRRGSVTLRGERLTGKSPRQILQTGVVHVPQNHSLFRDMTVRENIDLGGYILSDKALAARRMDAVFDMFPQVRGWSELKAGALSGGQQRLVEFARALMLDPALVLLDEPSMGLSPLVLKSVFQAVRQLNAKGTTILLVEQNARAGLKLSQHGVVLENGIVRLSGTGREVLEHPEIGELYLGGAARAQRLYATVSPSPTGTMTTQTRSSAAAMSFSARTAITDGLSFPASSTRPCENVLSTRMTPPRRTLGTISVQYAG